MRFAISIPQYARDSRFNEDAFRAHLRRVEELGLFESAWVQEQVIGAAGIIAPLQTLASGGRVRPFEAFGVDAEKPVARFNEALALMKACWTEREINFDGHLWKLE